MAADRIWEILAVIVDEVHVGGYRSRDLAFEAPVRPGDGGWAVAEVVEVLAGDRVRVETVARVGGDGADAGGSDEADLEDGGAASAIRRRGYPSRRSHVPNR